MLRRFLAVFEPFILTLVGTVILASLLPARGMWVPVFDTAADAGIVLLFFLHGAKLSREAILDGARNWRLHLAVFAATYMLFPLLGLGINALPILVGPLAAGMLFLTLLPSTVQSSIAFTAIARGNVAAAVCSASFSNVVGVVLTPALVALLMRSGSGAGSGGMSASASISTIETILLQLLLPFVVEGLWNQVSAVDLAILLAVCCVLLAIVLGATWGAAKAMKLSREDAIVLLFCGSKKSLASGVPMAGVLFPPAQVGLVILPLMLFHQLQLIACALIARRLAETAPES
jgi:sodium/bile acid cotransporter 7